MTLDRSGYRIYVINGIEEEVDAHGIQESRSKVRVRCSTGVMVASEPVR